MLEREALSPVGIGVETKREPSIGIALVIVGIDPSRNGENVTQPNLWTVIERKSKPETDKIAGQISFPGETRKINGERIEDNIIGALAEFTDNNRTIQHNLYLMPESSIIEGRIFIKSNPFDIVVLIHEGSFDNTIEPVDKDEVLPNGGMTIEEIRRKDPARDPRIVRDFVHQVAELEESERLISNVIIEYLRFPTKSIPLRTFLPKAPFSIRDFFQEREQLRDVIGGVKDGKQ